MLQLETNYDLTQLNSFGIQTKAQYYLRIESLADLQELPRYLESQKLTSVPRLILGGGSNILFVNNFTGLVLHAAMKGMSLIGETSTHFEVKALAGENWHEFVLWCLENNYQGVENLSLIPGSVGAAPVQNIGAYGVELKDICKEVEYFDLKDSQFNTISASHCHFSYRDSIFKHELKDRALITSVTFSFPKTSNYQISYGELSKQISLPTTALKISQAVTQIRQSKLPDPKIIGNAGSFFHNPIIDQDKAKNLLMKFPTMPNYPAPDGKVKIAAGWLIDQCGWKGHSDGPVGVYDKQALVLINRGNATGQDILSLAHKIQKSVQEKFQVVLTIEPLVL